MHHPGEQTKIHLNPDFISRGRAPLNSKVHVNPAFLQKSQENFAVQSHVSPAAVASTTNTRHGKHWQGLASGTNSVTTTHMTATLPHMYHGDTSRYVYTHSSKSMNGPVSSGSNTKTSNLYTAPNTSNTKTCDLYTKKSSTVPSSSNTKSHSLYSKNNIYDRYHCERFSSYTKGLPQTQNIVAKNVAVEKHSSSYSWNASNAKTWTSSNKGESFTSADMHVSASLAKHSEFVTQQYTYPIPAMKYSSVNKSFINTTVIRNIGASQKVTQSNENKAAVSHSSLHSTSYKKKNISNSGISSVKISGNVNPVKAMPPNPLAEGSCDKVTKTMTQAMQVAGQTSSDTVAKSKCPSLHISKNKNEKAAFDPLPQNTGGTVTENELHKVPKSVVSKNIANKSDGSVAQGMFTKAAQLTPNQKWVSKNKLVNSSYKKPAHTKATDLNSSSYQVALRTPRQKGNYKIITKTKLVKTNSSSTTKSKAQQQTGMEGQSMAHGSKTIHCTSPRVTSIMRASKLSPAFRTHHMNTRLNNKRRYSVLSHTKLIKSQNLSGKGSTPGKPKYSVNTKNKLVRRRSNSGSSKTLSKAKASKSETDKQKKFHVLSKTKIVRRRSSSGVYKVLSSPVVTTPALHRKRAIVKKHKLVRNVSSAVAKQDTYKCNRKSFPKRVNTTFKVINNSTKVSSNQRLAKGIVSKYKINRLKVDSWNNFRKHPKYFEYSKSRQKNKYKLQNKEGSASKRSDRFINIGGILYKSTKTSLRKQLPKANYKASGKKPDITCTVSLRGEKFHLTAGGKTLQRVMHSPAAKSSLARVHLGGLTYTRTHTGHYELTKTHQARARLSSARQRSVVTLMQKKRKALYQKRNEYCVFFNRFGRCTKKDRGQCPYVHDASRVAICTRFLRGRCPVNNCPFSHTIDPSKMPVCSHFLQAACSREDCPYRHVKVNPSAPVCLGFVRGHCKAGEECDKQHILICEEFKNGKCPRGASCPLSHHKGRKRSRKVSFSRDSARRTSFSMYRKRRRSESLEILGGPVIKKRVEKKRREVEPKTSQQRYFHLVSAEDSPNKDADGLETCQFSADGEQKLPEEKMSGVMRTLNSGSDNQATTGAKSQRPEDKVAETGTDHATGSAGKSLLEETRSRVMKKVDQMKNSHIAFSPDVLPDDTTASYENGNKEGISELRVSHQSSTATKEKPSKSNDQVTVSSSEASTQSCSDAENLSDIDQPRVQRPPLPKRLPSYIPLTLDED